MLIHGLVDGVMTVDVSASLQYDKANEEVGIMIFVKVIEMFNKCEICRQLME